jgi:hypothetical protein
MRGQADISLVNRSIVLHPSAQDEVGETPVGIERQSTRPAGSTGSGEQLLLKSTSAVGSATKPPIACRSCRKRAADTGSDQGGPETQICETKLIGLVRRARHQIPHGLGAVLSIDCPGPVADPAKRGLYNDDAHTPP